MAEIMQSEIKIKGDEMNVTITILHYNFRERFLIPCLNLLGW